MIILGCCRVSHLQLTAMISTGSTLEERGGCVNTRVGCRIIHDIVDDWWWWWFHAHKTKCALVSYPGSYYLLFAPFQLPTKQSRGFSQCPTCPERVIRDVCIHSVSYAPIGCYIFIPSGILSVTRSGIRWCFLSVETRTWLKRSKHPHLSKK